MHFHFPCKTWQDRIWLYKVCTHSVATMAFINSRPFWSNGNNVWNHKLMALWGIGNAICDRIGTEPKVLYCLIGVLPLETNPFALFKWWEYVWKWYFSTTKCGTISMSFRSLQDSRSHRALWWKIIPFFNIIREKLLLHKMRIKMRRKMLLNEVTGPLKHNDVPQKGHRTEKNESNLVQSLLQHFSFFRKKIFQQFLNEMKLCEAGACFAPAKKKIKLC